MRDGWLLMPPMCTRRDAMSITKKTK